MLPILLSTVWIGISEFVRNEFLLKYYWTRHYEGFGLVFPAEPINGALWGGYGHCASPLEIFSSCGGSLIGLLVFWPGGSAFFDVAGHGKYGRSSIWHSLVRNSSFYFGSGGSSGYYKTGH